MCVLIISLIVIIGGGWWILIATIMGCNKKRIIPLTPLQRSGLGLLVGFITVITIFVINYLSFLLDLYC
ncbi:MAG: hypothetical protein ACOC56_04355 [Atribacterota bacterium]